MTTLNGQIAQAIVDTLRANGYPTCTPEDVQAVARYGAVEPGTVSDDYDEALTDQILDQLDAHGVKAP